MFNAYRQPWLVAKLQGMAATVFGHEPLLWLEGTPAAIAAGPESSRRSPRGGRRRRRRARPIEGSAPTFATDDWPFLYLRDPESPPYYLAALGALLAFAVVAIATASRVTRMPIRRGPAPPSSDRLPAARNPSLVTFSLLFGTTWSVNALVFFAILLSVLVAIGISAASASAGLAPLYAGLFGTLALAWLLPPEQLLLDPPALRYILAAGFAFAPIVFANLVFAHLFRHRGGRHGIREQPARRDGRWSAEHRPALSGYRSLLFIVAGLYLLAYLFCVSLASWPIAASRRG